jgi:hypothetical protein
VTYLDDFAAATRLEQARKIEDALADNDVLAVPMVGGQHVVYRVPGWREAPVRRAKIAWYRARRRLFVAGR